MQKNDIFEAQVVDLTHEGLGVAKVDNFPFFIENALPTEKIRAKVTKIGKSFGYARVEELLSQSKERVVGANQDYLRTGIADLAHLSYPSQLMFKRQQVVTDLSKIAGINENIVQPILPAQQITQYRNKAQIPVRMLNGKLETGFFRKHSHDLLPIEDFYLQNPEIDAIILQLRNLLRSAQISAYDEQKNKGIIRNIVIRRAHQTGEIMIVLVLSKVTQLDSILTELLDQFPQIKSIQLSIKKDRGNAILGKEFKTLYGQDYITDELLGKKFQISAQSFYQVNSEQAEKLYQVAYQFADLKATDTVVDAYAGIGTVGLCIAEQIGELYGMEVIPEAVENAKVNAELNQISNAHYDLGKAEQVFPEWLEQGIKPDVIFVDPPRKGLDESFIQAAATTQARTIVYISCNPATFARDAKLFAESGYRLAQVQPVDLFPQTHHVECVGKFSRMTEE